MKKRTIKLGDYDTAAHGLWTLTGWEFPTPAQETNLVNVPGRAAGPLDLSTALTDGVPSYGARELTVTLESSEGDRLARDARISEMINKLHGQRVDFVLPDRPLHYGTGRLAVKKLYNDPAHASVEVTGTCEPWLYAMDETVVQVTSTAQANTVKLRNAGVMPVVPTLEIVAEEGASILLGYGPSRLSLSAGSYVWPELLLTPGDHTVTYVGVGTLIIKYREAVLE